MLRSTAVWDEIENRLRVVLKDLARSDVETERLARLMRALGQLPHPPDPGGHLPRYGELKDRFLGALVHGDADLVEEAFLELYAHLHMHEAPYTDAERGRVDATGGYWCHAGGLAPILKAGDWLKPGSVSADLGAGNGLQGLLMQTLFPHARTIQVEISSRMVEIGRRLQRWLGVPDDRVEWRVGDVLDASVEGIDLLYLYRPVRPDGPGRVFYQRLATQLGQSEREVVVFSIADCLRDFLPPTFEVFFSDGHLTCFRRVHSAR